MQYRSNTASDLDEMTNAETEIDHKATRLQKEFLLSRKFRMQPDNTNVVSVVEQKILQSEKL